MQWGFIEHQIKTNSIKITNNKDKQISLRRGNILVAYILRQIALGIGNRRKHSWCRQSVLSHVWGDIPPSVLIMIKILFGSQIPTGL